MTAYIKFAKCRPDAKIPTREEGSAGLDIYACFDEQYVHIKPHESKLISTGIKSVIDPDWYILFEERGSTGSNGIKKNCGVIDSNFRGEWFVSIYNSTDKDLYITKGINKTIIDEATIQYPYSKAICQGLVLYDPDLDIEEWTEEEVMAVPSLRGEGMLGSSGK